MGGAGRLGHAPEQSSSLGSLLGMAPCVMELSPPFSVRFPDESVTLERRTVQLIETFNDETKPNLFCTGRTSDIFFYDFINFLDRVKR